MNVSLGEVTLSDPHAPAGSEITLRTVLKCPDADTSVRVQVEMVGHGIDEKELALTAGS